MKKIFLFVISFILFSSNVLASSIIMDIDSGRIFNEKSSNEVRLIASTTKIMTAILAIESNRLEDIVTAKEEVLSMYGSNIYLELNENMTLLDLVYGLMLRSGNDASVVIANYVGGNIENFVKIMNKKAKELGLTNTTFSNPNGLDDDTKNYSTAKDLAILYAYAYKNKTFRDIVGTKYYKTTSDLKSYTWKNRNNLLFTYSKANGGKTGYTPIAGRLLVSSASNNDLNLCMVTIDKSSYLYEVHEASYEKIFSKYKNYLILDKSNFGVNTSLEGNPFIKESFKYPLTEEEFKSIKIKTKINENKKYKNNDKIGKVYIYLNDDIIYSNDIYIEKENKSIFTKIKNIFTTIVDKIF